MTFGRNRSCGIAVTSAVLALGLVAPVASGQLVTTSSVPGGSPDFPRTYFTPLTGADAGVPFLLFNNQELTVDPTTYPKVPESTTATLGFLTNFQGMAADETRGTLYMIASVGKSFSQFADQPTSIGGTVGSGLFTIDYGLTPGDPSSVNLRYVNSLFIDYSRPEFDGKPNVPGRGTNSSIIPQELNFVRGLAYDPISDSLFTTIHLKTPIWGNDRLSEEEFFHAEGLYRIDRQTGEMRWVFSFEDTFESVNPFTGVAQLSPTNRWDITAIDVDPLTGRLFGISNKQPPAPSEEFPNPTPPQIVEIDPVSKTINVLADLPARTDDFGFATILYPGLAAFDGRLYLVRTQENIDFGILTNPDLPLPGFGEAEHLVFNYLTGEFEDAIQSPYGLPGSFTGTSSLINGGGGAFAPTLLTPRIPGDTNLDLVVDDIDLAVLQANLGQAGIWFDGDFTGDRVVSLYDAYLLFQNYQPGGLTAIPEPASAGILLVGSMLLLRRRGSD